MKLFVCALAAAATLATAPSYGQGGLKDIIKSTGKTVSGIAKGATGGTGTTSLTNTEITAGLKEALNVGTKNATGRVSAVNGFLANAAIKVLMPPEAKKIETRCAPWVWGHR